MSKNYILKIYEIPTSGEFDIHLADGDSFIKLVREKQAALNYKDPFRIEYTAERHFFEYHDKAYTGEKAYLIIEKIKPENPDKDIACFKWAKDSESFPEYHETCFKDSSLGRLLVISKEYKCW